LGLEQNSWIATETIESLDVAAEAVAAKGASRGAISCGMASTVDLVAAYSIETNVLMGDAKLREGRGSTCDRGGEGGDGTSESDSRDVGPDRGTL
jgi:hypothetical protein